MRLLAGTSGFSYKEWVGPFYPPKLPAKKMLEHYARQLPTVEINNTFYRLPSAALLEGWRAQVPETFRFAVKAPRRITHIKRLADCADDVRYLLDVLNVLGPCLGSILFQLPPFQRKDAALLSEFLAHLPAGCRAAFEFRHESWFDEEIFELLAARGFALVLSETDETSPANLPWTAKWAYLRLRKTAYGDAELAAWVGRLVKGRLEDAQVFFKHEDEAMGPRLALDFLNRYRDASGS